MKKQKVRYDWVDVSKAIAMIFIYLGHWKTMHLSGFAYAFHLQLFFIVAGFFAIDCVKKYDKSWVYILKKIFTIMIPFMLWVWISVIFNNLDNPFELGSIIDILKDPGGIQPNYWFFPAIFSVSITYYFLKKHIKNDYIILGISYLLFVILGETGYINIGNILSLPVIDIFNNYFSIGAIFAYLFWYCLGVCSFSFLCNIIKNKEDKYNNKIFFNVVGVITLFISTILFLKDIRDISFIRNILKTKFILSNYKIITTIIISFSIIYLSVFMEKIECLKNIGKNTMSYMGLEFITHSYITLALLPMLNLGVPNVTSTVDVITLIVLQFLINGLIIKFINKTVPVLNGSFNFESCSLFNNKKENT